MDIQAGIYTVLNYIADNVEYFLVFTISMTVLVLVISTKYVLGNIFTIWNKGKPVPVADDADETDDEIVRNEHEDINWPLENDNANIGSGDAGPDPVQFCEHLQSEVKKARQRVATREIQNQLTENDIENERDVQRKQLEDIFRLMEAQKDKFGVASVDDIHHQMKLYA